MFDRVVLCKQGSTGESAVLPKIRNRSLTLSDGTVKVLLITGEKPSTGYQDYVYESAVLKTAAGGTTVETQELDSFFSCLTELHVVARGRASSDEAPLWTVQTGYAVVVVVNNQTVMCAVSDEQISSNEKLYMTFDIEETNNVLSAKADFDGVITQGILEERLKKIDADFDLGSAANKDVSTDVDAQGEGGKLPTNSAVITYVDEQIGTGTLTIKKNKASGSGTDDVSFSANEADNSTKTVTFGNAADKDFTASFNDSSTSDDAKLPTVAAVKGYVGDGTLTVTVGGNTVGTFKANQDTSGTVALGSAAGATVASSVNVADATNQAMLPTNDAVNNFVGKGTLRIVKGGTNNTGNDTNSASFGANQSGDTTFNLGLGDAADKTVDTSISGSNDSLTNSVNLPTSAAVASYVNSQIGKANLTLSVAGQNDVVFNANETTNKSLSLGNAASKTVDTSIAAPTVENNTVTLTDSANLPTSAAVASYVDAQLGTGTLTITKRDVTQNEVVVFSANEADSSSLSIEFGTASDKDVCTNIHQEQAQNTTSELNAAQEASLVTLAQARQIADESTSSSKSVEPSDANGNEDVVVEKGALIWLAVHFVGEVGIIDFGTSNQFLQGGDHAGETPAWATSTQDKATDAYIAKLNDNAGDFYSTGKKVAAGHTFRTLNAMDVSGMADPSYGFALCLCIGSPAVNP